MNFSKYKSYLKQYLQRKNYDTSQEFIRCLWHEEKTPSCKLYDDKLFCYGCNADHDIYDCVEVLEGITDKKEQFLFLENLFDGGASTSYLPPVSNKETFIADPNAQKKLESYLINNSTAEKKIIEFLTLRAVSSTFGTVPAYPSDLIPLMVKNFFYWPGLGRVIQDLGAETLRAAGIPLKNPNTGIAWWDHTGVLLKLGKGYKLHYYVDGDCKKFGSKGSSTFPMPGEIDKSKPVVIVEGEMDAVSTTAIGIENCFAAGGTNGVTSPKIKAFLLEVPEIVLCFDADEAGRKASGLIPIDTVSDKRKTNVPDIFRVAGFQGKIKIAELSKTENEKDADALIIAGKQQIVIRAIQEAREYVPPEKKADEKTDIKWDYLTEKRVQNILKKITKEAIEEKEPDDVQLFISAILKCCRKQKNIENDLLEWGATKEQIKEKNDVTPYVLIEFAWKYGLSKYLQRIIKIELTPASELLKRINRHKPIVDIDYEEIKTNKNVAQFLETYGVRAAALMVSDILDGRIIFVKSEKEYYFFNGHTWKPEPDMTGVIYNIIIAVMLYFYEKIDLKELGFKKSDIDEIIQKMEGRRFRVEIMQEFSQLEQYDVFKKSVLFDGHAVRETLTLIDGVMDFSGKEIVYRKSAREEYRREVLPYTIEQMKKASSPNRFKKFMAGNFKNEKTLETLFYYLSLIPSRNTKYKYGGVFIGETNTGKTATMDLISAVYPGMLKPIPAEILVSKGLRQVSGNEATPHIAGVEGKGCGIASETGRNLYLNNALWKLLTGGDPLTARDLYQSPHEFIPTAQILILTNYLPLFDSHDNATIQRMIIVPFLIEHKRGDKALIQIDDFKEQIKSEYPGIVKMFADYYIKLKHEHNGAIPLSDECKRYKQLYIEELDTDLDRFVKDNIDFIMEDNAFEETQTVYERYLKYYKFTAEDAGKEALTRQKFTRYLKRDYKQIVQKQKKINGKPELCFFNIRLKKDTGQTHEPRAEETPEKKPTQYAPPPDENPFE